jgi:hypothetical protein
MCSGKYLQIRVDCERFCCLNNRDSTQRQRPNSQLKFITYLLLLKNFSLLPPPYNYNFIYHMKNSFLNMLQGRKCAAVAIIFTGFLVQMNTFFYICFLRIVICIEDVLVPGAFLVAIKVLSC